MATKHVSQTARSSAPTPATVAAKTANGAAQDYDVALPGIAPDTARAAEPETDTAETKAALNAIHGKTAAAGYADAEVAADFADGKNGTREAAAEESRKKSSTVKLEDVQFGEIKPSAPDTFGTKSKAVPDEHPLMQAFRASYESKKGIDIETPDPVALTKILRRIASQEGKGVAIKDGRKMVPPRPGILAFKAQDRKHVVRKKSAAE